MTRYICENLKYYELSGSHYLTPETYVVFSASLGNFEKISDENLHESKTPYALAISKKLILTVSQLFRQREELNFAFIEADRFSMIIHALDEILPICTLLSRYLSLSTSIFSIQYQKVVSVEGHLYQFPTFETVKQFFDWRQEENLSHAVDIYCKWLLVNNGSEKSAASKMVKDLDYLQKLGVLRQNELSVDDLPIWQKNGVAIYSKGLIESKIEEKKIIIDTNLPSKQSFHAFLEKVILF